MRCKKKKKMQSQELNSASNTHLKLIATRELKERNKEPILR